MSKIPAILIPVIVAFTANVCYCDIKFQGNIALNDKELLRNIDQNGEVDRISDQIKTIYQNSGYYEMKIEKVYADRSQNRIFIINEGKPSNISRINLDLSPDDVISLLEDFRDIFIGRRAAQEVFGEFADGCLKILADNGMPFARGEWIEFSVDDNNDIIAVFRIMAGSPTIISRLEFNGISRTKPELLKKAAGLKSGVAYSEQSVSRSEKMIDKLPFIEISSPFFLEASIEGESCAVVYNIRELPSTRLDGGGAFVDIGGKANFMGRANIEFGDILGTGRSFKLFWNRKDAHSIELKIGYMEPFIFGGRINLELEAYQTDRDTLYITTGAKARLVREFGVDLTGAVRLSLERTVAEAGSLISTSNKRVLGMEFDYIAVDFAFNPRSGHQIGSELEYKFRSNSMVFAGQEPPSRITSAGVNCSIFFCPAWNMVLAIKGKGWGIVSADGSVLADDYRFVGGLNSLRGYTEQQFPAYRYMVLTLEPRLITGKFSRAYLFADFGAIKGSQGNRAKYKFKPGYGLGLVSGSRIGQLTVEIGWGDERFPSNAVIDFGIGGGF